MKQVPRSQHSPAGEAFLWATEEQLAGWAGQFAKRLRKGDMVLLHGPLGAGKTTLVKMAAACLGVKSGMRSPTYALIHLHQGSVPILHADLYRTGGHPLPELLDQIPDCISFVEWPGDGLAQACFGTVYEITIQVQGTNRSLRLQTLSRPASGS